MTSTPPAKAATGLGIRQADIEAGLEGAAAGVDDLPPGQSTNSRTTLSHPSLTPSQIPQSSQSRTATSTPSGSPVGRRPVQSSVDTSLMFRIARADAEIYLEKIYDLLEAPVPQNSVSTSSTASTSASVFQAGLGLFSVGGAKAKAMVKGFSTVKRNALSLKQDKSGGSKYVAGMKEIRVHSAEARRYRSPLLRPRRLIINLSRS